jgi:hypothetical protein
MFTQGNETNDDNFVERQTAYADPETDTLEKMWEERIQ